MKIVCLAICISLSTALVAQEGFEGEHFIEVTGTAETEIEPDLITTQISLKEFEENRQKVLLEKIEKDFYEALKASGIDKKRLVLANIGTNLTEVGKRNSDSFREKVFQLDLNGALELQKLLEKLKNAQVNRFRIVKLDHSQMEKRRMELKVEALKAAKTKADLLVSSIGASLGRALMIREWEDPWVPRPMEANLANVAFKAEAGAETYDMPFRKITLTSRITAQFEIK